ncbi:MAG: radical SAM protein, partial [Candidatus Omnitrophica bacterium]|nr:radical SAM protein [Candidatus Omnitrophota bacterium]
MLTNFRLNIKKLILTARIFKNIVPMKCYGSIFTNVLKNSLKLHTPSSAVLALTYRCQCNCIHCSAGLYSKNEELELNTEEWFSGLDSVYKMGVPRINLSGGEALIRKDIFDIIEYAAKKFVVILESNGLLLTEDNVKYLKKSRISCVAVSLDSPESHVHNNLRSSPGCFEKAIEGIVRLRKYKIPCLISTYFTSDRSCKENIKKITALAKRLGAFAVRVLPARPVGSFSRRTDLLLNKNDENCILQNIDHSRVYFQGLPAPKVCGIFCKATFYISPYGEVQPCPYLPFYFGNIRADALNLALDRMWHYHAFTQMNEKKCLILNEKFREKYLTPYLNQDNIIL